MRDISGSAATTARQIKTITAANRSHSQAVAALVGDITEIRRITERNASGVQGTRAGTADLLRSAQALASTVDDAVKKAN
jgi:methyl-accepting chemotaxis protein